jgi:Tol biopolymer transport system component
MSTRAGRSQIFTMARDGKDIRQVTRTGANYQPDWSK